MADAPALIALVPCAGTGSRAGTTGPKQYEILAGRRLVEHTLAALAAVARISRVLVVVAPGDATLATTAQREVARCGGATRAESVFNGLAHLRAGGASDADWVLVHDAARCLVKPALVDVLIDACMGDAVGGLLALPLSDTLKMERGGRVQRTVPRAHKWLAQTPQMFHLGALHAALRSHVSEGFAGVTDEASAMERAGHQPLLVRGSAHNFKVTYPDDFALAEKILKDLGR